jgi:hypothetical protein
MHAQILYTDITDTMLTYPENIEGTLDDATNHYYFDLDGDGNDDFIFSAHYWEVYMSPSSPEYPHFVMQLESNVDMGIPWDEGCAIDFAFGDTIRSDSWESSGLIYTDIFAYSTKCSLPFLDRYIGLRIIRGSDINYGWIRLDADPDTLVFKDFAINTKANEPIYAGQTSSADINEGRNTLDESMVYFDGNLLHFDPDLFKNYMISNISGNLSDNGLTSSNGILDLGELSAGFYIINLTGPDKMTSKKIIKW